MDVKTAKEAMEATQNLLGQINVPVALMEQIGIPILNAINNMTIGLTALEKDGDGDNA